MNSKIMNKKLVALFIVGLFVVSLASAVCYNSTDNLILSRINEINCPGMGGYWISDLPGVTSSKVYTCGESGLSAVFKNWVFVRERLCVWEDSSLGGVSGATLKYFLLALVVLMIYSALAYANFPDSFNSTNGSFLRFIIAFVAGILATFTITTDGLLAIMQSYTALGVTLSVFFPIMVLVFFTMVVASKGSPMGIFTSRIIWLIYSVYLFLQTGLALLLQYGSPTGGAFGPTIQRLVVFFLGSGVQYQKDPAITGILLISSIAIFVIFVWQGKAVDAWLAKEKRDSEIEGQKAELERSRAYDKLRSEEMKRT
jgi:hypothetical protein